MKYIIFLILTLTSVLAASAEDRMVFVVGNNVAAPITVTVGGRSYTVYTSLTVQRISGSVRATDANGNKLKYDFHHRSSSRNGSVDTYTFKNTDNYNNGYGTSNSNNNSNNNSNMNWGLDPRWGELGQELARRSGIHERYVDGQSYPGLHLYTGISKAYGEFVRLRIAYLGLNAYAGVGKDWLFDGVNKNKLLWHAGIGGLYTFGGNDPWGDILGSVTVAQTAAWENISLMIDCDFTYWFGRWKRVGCFAGAGFGFADIKDFGKNDGSKTKFAWNLEIGLTLRIAHF